MQEIISNIDNMNSIIDTYIKHCQSEILGGVIKF